MLKLFSALLVAFLLTVACTQVASLSGSCHLPNGDKVSHIFDAEGKKWKVGRLDTDFLGHPITVCSVNIKANPIPDGPYQWSKLYFTDEEGERKFYARARSKGKIILGSTGRNGLEWY